MIVGKLLSIWQIGGFVIRLHWFGKEKRLEYYDRFGKEIIWRLKSIFLW